MPKIPPEHERGQVQEQGQVQAAGPTLTMASTTVLRLPPLLLPVPLTALAFERCALPAAPAAPQRWAALRVLAPHRLRRPSAAVAVGAAWWALLRVHPRLQL